MAGMRAEEQTTLRILVVDDRLFQRRLTTETVRTMRNVEVEHVDCADHCIGAIAFFQPDVIITAWDMAGCDGLAMTQRIRAGEAGELYRAAPIILITERGRVSEIDRARAAGVDEFVQVPFSTATLLRRVREAQNRRRDFVESTKYVGPCRRRRPRSEQYDGPRRRLFDSQDKHADAPEVQIRKGLARMYAEHISGLLKAFTPGNADAARDLALTCGQVSALASDMKDRLLMSASSSLFNYVKGVGAGSSMNTDVVQAHLDAIVQLAELPNHQAEVRQTVTQQLSVMVTKKLRQAGQAA
jgi:CheY-like chemotaxis protein